MDKKNQLLDLVRKSQQGESDFISRLTDDEKVEVGTAGSWAIKDVFAHCAAWKEIMSVRIYAAMTGQEPPSYDDLDAFNEQIFLQNKDKTWTEVERYLDLMNSELLERIDAAPGDLLVDSDRYEWLQGRSLWRRAVHSGYFHPLGHIAFFYSERGDNELGNQIMEQITQTMRELDDSPSWQGQCIYNLACYYALTGDKAEAIRNLEQAFSFSSGIIEWSKTDTDLESIWDEPRYLALVENVEE